MTDTSYNHFRRIFFTINSVSLWSGIAREREEEEVSCKYVCGWGGLLSWSAHFSGRMQVEVAATLLQPRDSWRGFTLLHHVFIEIHGLAILLRNYFAIIFVATGDGYPGERARDDIAWLGMYVSVGLHIKWS